MPGISRARFIFKLHKLLRQYLNSDQDIILDVARLQQYSLLVGQMEVALLEITPRQRHYILETDQTCNFFIIRCKLDRTCKYSIQFLFQVSPHEFLQAVMKASNKRFQIGVQSDPVEFMSWLLNTLHSNLKSSKKKNRSIIYDCFQVHIPIIIIFYTSFFHELQYSIQVFHVCPFA